MIIGEVDEKELSSSISEEDKLAMRAGNSLVTATDRKKLTGIDGKVYSINGEKSECVNEFAYTLERRLFDIGAMPIIIDANDIDSKDNVMAIAKKIAKQGYSVIVMNGTTDNDVIVCNAKEGDIASDVKSLI